MPAMVLISAAPHPRRPERNGQRQFKSAVSKHVSLLFLSPEQAAVTVTQMFQKVLSVQISGRDAASWCFPTGSARYQREHKRHDMKGLPIGGELAYQDVRVSANDAEAREVALRDARSIPVILRQTISGLCVLLMLLFPGGAILFAQDVAQNAPPPQPQGPPQQQSQLLWPDQLDNLVARSRFIRIIC